MQHLNPVLGPLPGSIAPGASERDQNRVNSFATQNGSVKPDYTIEETVIGGMLTSKIASTVARVIGSLDVSLAGSVVASKGGNISASQITTEGMTVGLNAGEKGMLSQIDGSMSTTLQGDVREYVANNYFVRNGFTPLNGKCGSNCFDGVYVKGDTVYVNEVKPLNADGSIKLSGPSDNLPPQMTDAWINNAVRRLKDSGNPDAVATANLIQEAIANKNLVKLVSGVGSDGMTVVKLGGKP